MSLLKQKDKKFTIVAQVRKGNPYKRKEGKRRKREAEGTKNV